MSKVAVIALLLTALSIPNTIAIDAKSEKPAVFILMHEVVHNMAEEDPKTYKDLRAFLWKFKSQSDFNAYSLMLNQSRLEAGQEALPLNPYLYENKGKQTTFDEFIAEGAAHYAFNTKFWDTMQKRNPSLFGRFVNFIVKFMNKLHGKIDTTQTQDLRFFNDIDGIVFDKIVDAFQSFSLRQARAFRKEAAGGAKFQMKLNEKIA